MAADELVISSDAFLPDAFAVFSPVRLKLVPPRARLSQLFVAPA
jgi:hypothetical protein